MAVFLCSLNFAWRMYNGKNETKCSISNTSYELIVKNKSLLNENTVII